MTITNAQYLSMMKAISSSGIKVDEVLAQMHVTEKQYVSILEACDWQVCLESETEEPIDLLTPKKLQWLSEFN
jgi:hypothetical protein